MNTEEELEKVFKTINTDKIKSMLENQTQTYLKFSHAFILKSKHKQFTFFINFGII